MVLSGRTKTFLAESRRNFHTTGALLPSGKSLAFEVTKHLAIPHRKPLKILEVGPGTGPVTRIIAKRMIKGDTLDAVEINPAFARAMAELVANDVDFTAHRSRIQVIEADLVTLPGNEEYDAIICGLPFNNFDSELVGQMFNSLEGLLKPGGRLSYFEYWAIQTLKLPFVGSKTRQRLRGIGRLTGEIRKRMGGSTRLILANFPPALVHHLLKPMA
ncbi:MAG: methyltransferase domain-containing protein [Planctomycetota bacterium]|nr:methyltransferase domain-containing protein [Planctomycetota bacterium]